MEETRVGFASAIHQIRQKQNPYEDSAFLTKLIREALIEGGLGKQDSMAPLKDIIRPGMTVLLKPNWVLHENMSGKGMDCMITHPNFILAVLKEVLVTKPGKIIIGDAPIQRTVFNLVVTEKFRSALSSLANNCPVQLLDFRRDIWKSSDETIIVESEARGIENYIEFDLATASLLEEISDQALLFRNTMYNHRELAKTHTKGCHRYLLCKEIFEADVILNLPKLKAHRKAGITAALKNIVGINGSKAYLPHHRVGGSALNGDCYRGLAPFKRVTEFFIDKANTNIKNIRKYHLWIKASRFPMKIHRFISSDMEMEGGWHGNDTVWRMVLDLNRLLLYGNLDGSLSSKPLRKIYSLTDAIIAGEGFGPLAPEPIGLGAVTFSSSSVFADLAHCAFMHFDWNKIPLVKQAFEAYLYPLTSHKPDDILLYTKGHSVHVDELAEKWGLDFKPPNGWDGHIERR